jgi:hypothetical protein
MFVPTISGTLSLRSDFGTTLLPSSVMTVYGMLKMKGSSFDDNGTLITDNCSFSSDISDKVVACQRVVSVKGGGRQNIHVRICNITAPFSQHTFFFFFFFFVLW